MSVTLRGYRIFKCHVNESIGVGCWEVKPTFTYFDFWIIPSKIREVSHIFDLLIEFFLTDLITFDRPFFVGCIREPRKMIQKKNIPAHQYWFATHSKRTNTWALATHESKKANILISEEWVHNNLPRFTGNLDAYKYKPLPPLLELNEDEKFRDIEGNVHEVEVRGVRSREGIRFSCRDVARVFEMETLDHI